MGAFYSRALAAGLLVIGLNACAATHSTEQTVLRYNRAFANSRNEMLVLNILRSAAREPMQFSTMGTVTGQVGNGLQLTIPFTNVIAGGRDMISPSLQITDAVNPTINVLPLGAKEFVTGIMTPLGADDIQLFLHAAWDAEFLLPVVIGGVLCPDGRLLHNRGAYGNDERGRAESQAFRDFFADSAPNFSVETPEDPRAQRVLTLTDQQTADLLRQGLGSDHAIVSIENGRRGHKRVTIRPNGRAVLAGLVIDQLCRQIRDRRTREERTRDERAREERRRINPEGAQGVATATRGGRVMLRSVQTIIYFLGETHRERLDGDAFSPEGFIYSGPADSEGEREDQILFRVESGSSTVPHAVELNFHGTHYYIPRQPLGGEPRPRNRTLKTLSFLDQLIALQTSEASIRGSQPILAIPR